MSSISQFNPHLIHLNFSSGPLMDDSLANMPRRMAMWYEIELITDGNGQGGVMTDGRFLPANQGTLYVRKPGMIVQGFYPYCYKSAIFDCVYDESMLSEYSAGEACLHKQYDMLFCGYLQQRNLFFDCLDSLPPHLTLKDYDAVDRIMNSLFHNFLSYPAEKNVLAAKSLLIQLVAHLNDELTEASPLNASGSDTILLIQHYIDTNYSRPITLTELAREATLSREYLCRSFRKMLGVSPIDYLISVRLFHAKQMLNQTSDPVKRISEACGFSSEQYFFALFRRKVGMTPLQYRQYVRNI